jgi:hypothetical protein
MSENVIQTSFQAGELSPNLNARVDFAKYRSGCATLRNFFVDYRSGASTRPGTEFIRAASGGGSRIRLVRFQQSTDVSYVLEFGNHYIRFISNGGSIVEPLPFGISDVSQSNPGHVTVGTIGFADTQMVFIDEVAGMPQINNRYFHIFNVTIDGFDLYDGVTVLPVNTTNWPPYGGGGRVRRVYTLDSPYGSEELPLLKFSQNAAVMNITHPDHAPYVLTLIAAFSWTLVPATFGSSALPPSITSVVPVPGAGTVSYKYAVTGVDNNNQESEVGNVFIITTALDLRVAPGSNQINWGAVTGAFAYNIYGTSPSYSGQNFDIGGLGFIGSVVAPVVQFTDSNVAPDFSQTPPTFENPFATIRPAVSSYFQQRLIYANGGGVDAATFWASKTGAPYNFDISNPIQANDAITGTLVSLEVNEIKSLIPMPTGLIALTSNGAWQINGGAGGVATQGGPITPVTATATPQAYIGADDTPPIVVNFDILFVQAKGSIVRDLTFNIYQNIYTGNDISILSSHLFYGHRIEEWAYAEEPFKVIWVVRNDGILLSLTLVKEQDMYGWARHDTQGNYMSVCTVTEGNVDATYVAVLRTTHDGNRHVFIERLAERQFQFGAEDAWCVDAGVSTDSFHPQTTLLISATTGEVTMSADLVVFSPGSIGAVVKFGGGIIRITEFLSGTAVKGIVLQEITDVIPNDPQGRPDLAQSGEWSLDGTFNKVYGLDHLEGFEVSVLADGGVVNGMTVQDGSITLPGPVTKVIVGLGYQAQLQTMPLDLGNEANSVQGKRKKVAALTVRVKDARGVKAGMTFQTVTPIKELNRVTTMGTPVRLYTSDERIVMDPLWDVPGQICLQVDDPLPATILGVIPEVVVGDGQK